jgi:DNA-binding beta-propeller fold protein YncE
MRKHNMITGAIVVMLIAGLSSFSYANPWAVVANHSDQTIHTIELGTSPPTVHGPFLMGQLGIWGSLCDVAVTPDNHYALITNFELSTLYRVDLTNLTNPTLAGSINIGFYASDSSIAPNGQFALITDGGGTNRVAIINLTTFTLDATYTLTTSKAGAQAVDIAPDNQTVILCDFDNDRIIYGTIDPATGLTSESTLPTINAPLNVTISPDGQTALVGGIDTKISVFRITDPGVVEAGTTVSGLPDWTQSIAFSPDGQKAYAISSGGNVPPDRLSWLQVNGPGNVVLGGANVASLPSTGTSSFIGVDVLAVDPDGTYALVGNTSWEGSLSRNVTMINLATWAFSSLITNSDIPVGIDIFGEVQTTTTSTTPTSSTTSTTTTITQCPCLIKEIYSENAEEVAFLRNFRDEALSKTPSGRELIKLYYQVSPMLVEMLEDDELLRESFIRFYYEWGPALLEAIEEDEAFRSEIKEMIDGVLPLIREIVE